MQADAPHIGPCPNIGPVRKGADAELVRPESALTCLLARLLRRKIRVGHDKLPRRTLDAFERARDEVTFPLRETKRLSLLRLARVRHDRAAFVEA